MAKERLCSLPAMKASLDTGVHGHIACEATNNNHTTVILYNVDINRLQIQKVKREATERLIRNPIIRQGVFLNPYTWLGLLTDMPGISVGPNSRIHSIKLPTGHRITMSHQLICLFCAPMYGIMYSSNDTQHEGSRY